MRHFLRPLCCGLAAAVFTATSATAQTQTNRPATVQPIIFDNGRTVLVREDHRLPFVNFYGTCKGGLLAETDAINGVTALMARLLPKGTKSRTAEQIADEIESGGGSIGASGGNNSFNISAEVLTADFNKALDFATLFAVLYHLTGEQKYKDAVMKATSDGRKLLSASGPGVIARTWLKTSCSRSGS